MTNEYEIVLAKQMNFYTINSIGPAFKIVLNPRWEFLYQDYKEKGNVRMRYNCDAFH